MSKRRQKRIPRRKIRKRPQDVTYPRLRDVVAQIPAAICITRGPRHTVEAANAAYMRLVGNRKIVGKSLREILQDSSSPHVAVLDRVYNSGTPYTDPELQASLPGSGNSRVFNVTYQPLRGEKGRVRGVITHAVDVTERVAARKALEERTGELSRLANALERSNSELDAFAYAASHDLRAPLRGIANLAQWIEEDLQDTLKDETRDMLQLMRSRMHRMESLIQGILQYARAGRAHSAPETVVVSTLLREVIDLIAPGAGTSIRLSPDLPVILTERMPLQQVFMNLVSNALKYGGPQATVEIGSDDRGDFYEFSVADNGPGIPPEVQDRIWGIFQTLATHTVEAAGVGLALVKKLVEAQEGQVWVESTTGQGSTFRFLWPKRPPPRTSPATATPHI
jgi:PAS domain S-box-containing protein